MRQQLQGKVKVIFGRGKNSVDFGYCAVDNEACLGCHDHPNDRRPFFCFAKPRFAEAWAKLQTCTACHREHRVTLNDITYLSKLSRRHPAKK